MSDTPVTDRTAAADSTATTDDFTAALEAMQALNPNSLLHRRRSLRARAAASANRLAG